MLLTGIEGLEFGGETVTVFILDIVKGLLSETVAGYMHLIAPLVVDGKGIHPFQLLQTGTDAVMQVGLRYHLGVAVGVECRTLGGQLLTQFLEIVDFAVVDDDDVAIVDGQGLMTCLDVDDGEPAVRQGHTTFHKHTAVVRTTTCHPVVHIPDGLLVGLTMIAYDSCYSTHILFFFLHKT